MNTPVVLLSLSLSVIDTHTHSEGASNTPEGGRPVRLDVFRVSITAKWEKGRRLRVKTPSGSVHTVLQRRLFQLDSHRFHLCAAAAAAPVIQ